MKKIALFVIFNITFLLNLIAQDFSANVGVGVVYPIDRTYFSVELCNKIAPNYTLILSTELSKIETNLSPKLLITYKNIGCDCSFGWGHKFGKEEINDHNYHTYTIGLYYMKNKYFIGTSMFWRSYQSHIGFHKGTLRLCFGIKLFNNL